MSSEQNRLLFRIRTEGRRLSVPRIGEAVYELEGRLYRYFCSEEIDRKPGEGCWRAEPLATPRGMGLE